MKVLAEFRNNGTEGIGCLGTGSDARLGIGNRRSHTKHTLHSHRIHGTAT